MGRIMEGWEDEDGTLERDAWEREERRAGAVNSFLLLFLPPVASIMSRGTHTPGFTHRARWIRTNLFCCDQKA